MIWMCNVGTLGPCTVVLFGEVVDSSAQLIEVFKKKFQLFTVAENLLVIVVVM